MTQQKTPKPIRIKSQDRVPRSRPDLDRLRRIPCGGGYRIIRKTIPGD